jgi:hypothetical protein
MQHGRMFIMQLGSIELLNINAQTLHQVKITKRAPRRRIIQSVLALLKGSRVSLDEASRRLPPKCSLLMLGTRTYMTCYVGVLATRDKDKQYNINTS